MSENVLFYLSTCSVCNIFMQECQRIDILKKFNCVKVDGRIDFFVSKGITMVPTIILKGCLTPLVGKNKCSEWLASIKQVINTQKNDEITPYYNIENSKKQVTQPPSIHNTEIIQKNTNTLNIDGFRDNEMNAISDNYAYKDNDDAFPMAFQRKNLNFEIKTAPELKKINNSIHEKLIKTDDNTRVQDKKEFLNKFEEDYQKYTKKNIKNPYFKVV